LFAIFNILLAGYAIFSGYRVATVFGAISANINTIMVSIIGAIIAPKSSYILIAAIVAILEAKILEKVLPISIVDNILSGVLSSLITLRASLSFLLALCCSL
jgi:hypothetical protein